MRNSTKSALVVAALAATTLAPSLASAGNAPTRRHVVEIHNFKFIPAVLEVSPGDTIVWINRDIVPHTATATNKSWDSGTIGKASDWKTVVNNKFPDAYFCRFHPTMKARFKLIP